MSPNRVEASKIIESSAPSLRMQLYVVTSTANSLDAVKQNLAEHRAYLRSLAACRSERISRYQILTGNVNLEALPLEGWRQSLQTPVPRQSLRNEERLSDRLLEDQNVLFGAGPLWTEDGQYFEGDGMLIYRAASVEEATAIAQGDPMHSSGARTFKIRPWLLNDGSITIRITLSEPQRNVF